MKLYHTSHNLLGCNSLLIIDYNSEIQFDYENKIKLHVIKFNTNCI